MEMFKKPKQTMNAQESQKKVNRYVSSYGLWQKSNTSETNESNSVPVPTLENVHTAVKGVQVVRDHLNRKMVKRDGLYCGAGESNQQRPGSIPVIRPQERQQPNNGIGSQLLKEKGQPTNKIQRNLTKALAQPVEISKGATMLQKMGWQGGALGKTGTGIVEPIAPDATYAATTKGLGHTNETAKPVKRGNKPKVKTRQRIPRGDKQIFKVNVLNLILEFVQDDNEIELVFEDTLQSKERLLIHNIVNSVINVEEIEEWWCNDAQMEIVQVIQERSCYVLGTQSHGENPKRQLTIFKETPPNVYLVIPDDLKDDIEGTPNSVADKKMDNAPSDGNTGNMAKTETELVDKIIGYFTEFIDEDQFTDFRFLGPFDPAERLAITKFFLDINVCTNHPTGGHQRLLRAVEGRHLEIYEDCNGSTVIHKVTDENATA